MRFLVLGALALSGSSASAAYDFSSADQVFLQRQQGAGKIENAVAAYEEALKSNLSVDEKAYAVEQIATLYMYYEHIVDQSDERRRIQISDSCLNKVKLIEPKNGYPKTPQYYYWRAACMMARANAGRPAAALSVAQTILDTIEAGRSTGSSYEGGGFDRLAGIMYFKLPVGNPFGPSGDYNRALNYLRKSMDADAYRHPLSPSWRNIERETGAYFYPTHYYYAETLVANTESFDAKNFLEQTISAIDAGEVAEGREAETAFARQKMQELLNTLN